MALRGQDKIKQYIEKSKYKYKKELIEFASKNKYAFEENVLFDMVKIVIDNNYPIDEIDKAASFYNIAYNNDYNSYNMFLKLFEKQLSDDATLDGYKLIYGLFNDKNNIIFFIDELEDLKSDYLKTFLYQYIVQARRYYLDEKAFLSSVSSLIDVVNNIPSNLRYFEIDEKVNKILNKRLEEDKLMAGLYPINEEKIKEQQEKLNEITKNYELLKEQYNDMSKKIEDNLYEPTVKENDSKKSTVKEDIDLNKKAAEILNSILTNLNIEKVKLTDNNKIESTNKFILNEIKAELKEKGIDDNRIIILTHMYYAVYNDNYDLFKELINRDISWENFGPLTLLDQTYSEYFDKDTYMSFLKSDSKLHMLIHFINDKEVNLLKQIIDINKDFEFPNIPSYHNSDSLKELINMFGINRVASCDKYFLNVLKSLYSDSKKYYLKKVYDINPNFIPYCDDILVDNYLYKIDEVAYFDEKKQRIANEFIYKFEKDKYSCYNKSSLIKKARHMIGYIYNEEKDIYVNGNLFELLNDFNIPIGKYCMLDYDSQISLIQDYEAYLALHDNSFKKEIKEKVRIIKKS